jgi:hypothetical protein
MPSTGKPTKESIIQGHRTVRAKALARKLQIEGRDINKLPPLGDAKWVDIAKSAGVSVPNSLESIQLIVDEFKKLKGGGDMPEFAKGGIVAPSKKLGRMSSRGHWYGPKNSIPPMPKQKREAGPPAMPV